MQNYRTNLSERTNEEGLDQLNRILKIKHKNEAQENARLYNESSLTN